MQVNVSPDMGMYHLLRSQGYDPAYAIAEFVDNAIQAHLSCAKATKEPLNVELRFYLSDCRDPAKRNSIVVTDDGPGIARNRLGDAMKPAKPAPEKGLSEFGIGMKAAAVWFSDTWTLQTTPQRSNSTYKLTFNLPELLKSGESMVEVKTSKSHVKQGTSLALTQLRRSIDANKFKTICDELRELYQRFTAGESPILKLTAYLNDTPVDLKYIPPDRTVLYAPAYKMLDKQAYAVGESKSWIINVDIVFEGASVQGFICLLERGSYKTNPGLVIFRNDRLIKGTLKRPNLPQGLFKTSNKYARQRVYGELFVDSHMPVTYTKDGFEIDEDAFADKLAKITGMPDLLRQAEEYRAKGEATMVASEADLPNRGTRGQPAAKTSVGGGSTTSQGVKNNTPGASQAATSQATPNAAAPIPKAIITPAFCKLLDEMKGQAKSIALRTMMDEAKYQYQWRRPISAAMCLRAVTELAVMDKIRNNYPAEYNKVSEKGIKSLLNYMNSNSTVFFDPKKDYIVIKCVQGLSSGAQADVILMNNVSHGHYNPSQPELNTFASNVEALLRWAFI